MEVKIHKIALWVFTLVFVVLPLLAQSVLKQRADEDAVFNEPQTASEQSSQEPQDSLIRLLSASSAQLYQEGGHDYRRVIGSPAIFLHNDTYLYCDTAVWNVSTNVVNSWGNVRIIQENTQLTGDRLIYLVDSSLAQFRGSVVRLESKDGDLLLTRHLDYNTKDSIATFFQGASMKDHDGQIIESIDGCYESQIKKFTFSKDVNMFSDTTFIKCDSLEYFSQKNTAYFYRNVNAWHDKYMLSSALGVYDREREIFTFRRKVHLQSDTQEGWCDTLLVYRETNNFDMLSHSQLDDSQRSTNALAGHIFYRDAEKKVTLRRLPAVVSVIDNKDEEGFVTSQDSLFFSADDICYYSEIICEMADSTFRETVSKRKAEITEDPVGEYRRKAAEAAAKAREEAELADPNSYRNSAEYKAKKAAEEQAMKEAAAKKAAEMTKAKALADSLAAVAAADTTARDSSALVVPVVPKDSTKVDFMVAVGNVKTFKEDIQIRCDSMLYNNFDSLARIFKNPVIWKDKTQQFNADSISMVIENGAFDRIFMMSNSFVQLQDADTLFFNQIRSAEMVAYFDTTTNLSRYDALGDATAIFYLEENGVIATANRKECKMLSAEFVDGEISKVYYYDSPKSNAFPVASMSGDDKILKGFSWRSSERPRSRWDVTQHTVRPSERRTYDKVEQPPFVYTGIFFPGYIKGIREEIQYRKDHPEEFAPKKKNTLSQEEVSLDTLTAVKGPEESADSVATSKTPEAVADSSAVASTDSSAVAVKTKEEGTAAADSVATGPTKKELKAAEREAKRQAAQQKREAKWKAADEKAQKRAEAKEKRKLEKLRRNKLKAYREEQDRLQKEDKQIQHFLRLFREGKLKYREKEPVQESSPTAVPGASAEAPEPTSPPARKQSIK